MIDSRILRSCKLIVCLIGFGALQGCIVPQPAGKGEVHHLQEPRTKTHYYLYLPEEYVRTNGKRADGAKWPMVITFHGMKPFDTYDRQINEWQEESDRYGFVTVAPYMYHASLVDEYPVNRKSEQFLRDADNVLAVMQDVFRRTEADPRRVLATGWSQGGYMAHYIVNEHPEMFAALVVKQCNFSAEVMDPTAARRYRDMPVGIFYTENDFGICREESIEGVAWYRRLGFRNLTSGVIDKYGHERMPEVAADLFAKVCGTPPRTPPTKLVRIQTDNIPAEELAKAGEKIAVAPASRVVRPRDNMNYAEAPYRRNAPTSNPQLIFRDTPTNGQDAAARTVPPLPDGITPARTNQTVPPPAVGEPTLAAAEDRYPVTRVPEYRVPPRPAPDQPTPRRTPPPVQASRTVRNDIPIGLNLSTTIGLTPLMINFSVNLPSGQLRNADILWTDNGEPFASGRSGQRLLTEVGKHEIAVLVITSDGMELRQSKTVTVYPRAHSSLTASP